MVSYKERMPAMCLTCVWRDDFECQMLDIDIRKEKWLKEFDGCNNYSER